MQAFLRFCLIGLSLWSLTRLAEAQFDYQEADRYSRHVLIRHTPELLPLDHNMLTEVINAVQVRARRKAAPTPNSPAKIIVLSVTPMLQNRIGISCRIRFRIGGETSAETVQKFGDALLAELAKSLGQMQDLIATESGRERNELRDRLSKARDQTEQELAEIEQRFVRFRIRSVSSTESIQQRIEGKESQLQDYELKLAGYEARRQVMEQRIDELRKQAEIARSDDELIRELEIVIELRHEAMERTNQLYKQGVTGEDQLRKAREALSQAKIDLLRTRRDAVDEVTSQQLASLNGELTLLLAMSVETRAFQQKTAQRSAQLEDRLEEQIHAEIEMQRAELQMKILRDRAARLASRQVELEDEFELIRQVKVIPWGE